MISPSFSKVNIGLKVLNQRDDGYHNIYTVFQETDFGDLITIEKTDLDCVILSNVNWIPRDESNTCYKAYNALKTIHPNLKKPILLHLSQQQDTSKKNEIS